MFKKLTILSSLFFVIIGCITPAGFGKVKVTKDNFKNIHNVNLKMLVKSEEALPGAPFESMKYGVILDFTREIGIDKINPTAAQFTIYATALNRPIEKSGFVKIGDKVSPLIFGNTLSERVTTISSGATANNTQNVSNSQNVQINVKSHAHFELKGTFLLKKEDEDAIRNSNEFSIRLYSGTEPITISFVDGDLAKFKEYLNAKPEAGN
ncbi:hypothetical protein [Leptospira licerasiae]|uniref:hypothetical protein n=1 Tax=Leptospira licerasiae TaxID=447106 RepID=UPI00301A100D